ncbi:hypothetical protein V8E36_000519 [Tilletia maclaganii]
MLLQTVVLQGLSHKLLKGQDQSTVASSTLIPGNAINAAGERLAGISLTTVEITAKQMVLCMNLATFAWEAYDSQQRTSQDGWSGKPLLVKIGLTQLAGLCAPFKYYGIWSLTNGACVPSALAYNGITPNGKELWDRCRNIDIIHIGFASSSWNMNTDLIFAHVALCGLRLADCDN